MFLNAYKTVYLLKLLIRNLVSCNSLPVLLIKIFINNVEYIKELF